MWRVMTGQHRVIEYHMQVPGHARCLVDTGFAHIKNRYRRADCETLDELSLLVDQSTKDRKNVATCYPTWVWRRWKPFLEEHFKPVPGIMKFQYFRFEEDRPGVVFLKTRHDAAEERLQILRNPAFCYHQVTRPPIVEAAGMTDARKEYPRRSVRPYLSARAYDYYD